ncbi:hypothetical protein DFQ28_008357 [Apophysomyces sp. BC1034]|nr:hypothetical protein DFQ28_008357 [Apophysomyces sp. BC1034]
MNRHRAQCLLQRNRLAEPVHNARGASTIRGLNGSVTSARQQEECAMSGVDLDTRVETYTVKIRGAVQGVGFRHAAVRRAHALRVRGWIANHDDGSVNAVVQGPANQIDLMLEFLRHGPPRAKVSEFIANEDYSERRYNRFEQH